MPMSPFHRPLSVILVGMTMIAFTAPVMSQERGQAIYLQQCLVCHGADGTGAMPGVPDLTEPSGVLSKADELLLGSLINGVQRPGAPLLMPPKGGNPALTETDMQDVLIFIRREFTSTTKLPKGVP